MHNKENEPKTKEGYNTNMPNNKAEEKYISKFELSSNKNIKSRNNKNKERHLSLDEEYNDDFLLSLRRRFDDIFKQVQGHEKIFEDLEQKYKKKKVSNEVIKGAVFLRKLNFQENFPKKKEKKFPKLDVNKVIEIQRVFKGFFIRNINYKIDRLKFRQCLVELFCLLIYGNWYRAKIRYYFLLLRECYIVAKLEVGKELNFTDRLTFKLPNRYYTGAKIKNNNLISDKLGEDLLLE
jgi:hypothetical protein